MYIALGLMFLGIFAGRLLRTADMFKRFSTPGGLGNLFKIPLSAYIMAVICLLLFVLGLELGYNEELLSKFASIGVKSSAIAVCAVIGSCLAAKILYACISNKEDEYEG